MAALALLSVPVARADKAVFALGAGGNVSARDIRGALPPPPGRGEGWGRSQGPHIAAEDTRPADKIPGLQSRVFQVKYRPLEDLLHVLRPLASGVKGTNVSESEEFRTITVRDFPENIADIEGALKRL